MKHKKFTAVWLAIMIVFSTMLSMGALSVSAGGVDNKETSSSSRWTNVSSVTTTLAFSGNTATCKAQVDALGGTTSIKGTMVLYQKNTNGTYTEVARWTKNSSNSTLIMSEKHSPITSGKTYKLTISANVTLNGTTETVTGQTEVTAP